MVNKRSRPLFFEEQYSFDILNNNLSSILGNSLEKFGLKVPFIFYTVEGLFYRTDSFEGKICSIVIDNKTGVKYFDFDAIIHGVTTWADVGYILYQKHRDIFWDESMGTNKLIPLTHIGIFLDALYEDIVEVLQEHNVSLTMSNIRTFFLFSCTSLTYDKLRYCPHSFLTPQLTDFIKVGMSPDMIIKVWKDFDIKLGYPEYQIFMDNYVDAPLEWLSIIFNRESKSAFL